jgi:hypothetical protein
MHNKSSELSPDDRDLVDAFDAVLRVVTRETLLKGGKNGGAVVTARATSVTIVLFLPAFMLSWVVAREPFLPHFVERLSWLAAIFAASYTAFYARFASQWGYLANLYNQISQAELGPDIDQDALARWKAGFVSDAIELHLWQKGNFVGICARYWRSDRVREHFRALPQVAVFAPVTAYLDAQVQAPEK